MSGETAFLTLGIETSCDETSVAVLRGEYDVLINSVYSQADIHTKYGGVVPEVASRNHVVKLPYLIQQAVQSIGVRLQEISLIAATYGPGLVGPLLVGLTHGKGLAYGLGIPFIGVNHLEGHVFAHRLTFPDAEPPFMALVVSGGHTSLIDVPQYGTYQLVGMTVDDAAGEALDKIGKMMGIGYPAGAEIDRLATLGDPKTVRFPRPMIGSPGFDFSFSGLKTSVVTHLKKNPHEQQEDIAASVLASVVEILTKKSIEASRRFHRKRLVVTGGVAANSHLRHAMTEVGGERGIEVSFPPLSLCTDNAAMIAAVGAFRFLQLGESHPLSLKPSPSLSLGSEKSDK
ncbi:tRNA (adenosine(37)-N6)-threonylcarbamoyltransferase complex transferase subunit TsaD [Candidatus Bipolaricaulota bacterium]